MICDCILDKKKVEVSIIKTICNIKSNYAIYNHIQNLLFFQNEIYTLSANPKIVLETQEKHSKTNSFFYYYYFFNKQYDLH